MLANSHMAATLRTAYWNQDTVSLILMFQWKMGPNPRLFLGLFHLHTAVLSTCCHDYGRKWQCPNKHFIPKHAAKFPCTAKMQWVSTPQTPIRVDDDEGDGDGHGWWSWVKRRSGWLVGSGLRRSKKSRRRNLWGALGFERGRVCLAYTLGGIVSSNNC